MSVHLIPLAPDLLDEVQELAESKNTSVEAFVNLAVRERLNRLWDEKLKAEAQALEKAHPKLVKQYLGQYVAMREERLLRAGKNFEDVFLQVQARFGNAPVLIRLITVQAEVELRGPSPRLEYAQ